MMASGKIRPIAVDLFAGAGGMTLGFEQAGFDVLAAVEIDPIHACTHVYNFPVWTVLCRNIIEITGEEIRKLSPIGDRHIDVVFGGPPCQGYSYIGHRALDDPRNLLVRDFVRIVLELKPSYFVFENVKGLTASKNKCFLYELIETFSQNGYQVRLPWQVLNAAYYGIPQRRERLFLIGAKQGFVLPEYPTPCSQLHSAELRGSQGAAAGVAHSPSTMRLRSARNFAATLTDPTLPFTPSCWDALGDLPEAEEFEELLYRDWVKTEKWNNPSSYGREMRCLDDSCWHFGYKRNWNSSVLTSSMRTNHSPISRARFQNTKQGKKEPISHFFKLAEKGLANTLRAGTDAAHGAHTSPRPIHYSQPRCITVREMARLHGFPDWFRFHVTKWHGARQVGNSVPPPIARAIGLEITKCLGIKVTSSEKMLELGDFKLLSMNIKQAANYWHLFVLFYIHLMN
jgi:DNA (cytosine-5)-methyltransferase 1